MEHRRGILFDAKGLAHFDHKAAHESGVSVMDKGFWESYMFEHMFQVEFSNSFCCNCFVAQDEDNCFGAVVVGDGECHEPRYWSATDQYRATLLQGKQAQDVSLWFPYRFRAGRTTGNSRGHSLVQSPECGNEFNQAWESCTTTG